MTNKLAAISANLVSIRAQILTAAQQFDRPLDSVQLLAVSKTHAALAIRSAYQAGQRLFGENYVQEALEKMADLKDLAIEWHFIGGIQTNKTRHIAENFHWVHSIDRLHIAERLSAQRPQHLLPLNICIEVNLSNEPKKSGVILSELKNLIIAVRDLPNLCLRGLMAIPAFTDDFQQQCDFFATLADAKKELQQQGYPLDTLSMGMSHDYVAAISQGATIVRIGTAIFGEREP